MSQKEASLPLTGGAVHKAPADLQKTIISAPTALKAWKDITPLARNEWGCWAGCPHR